jgi:hypothetical protein
MDSNLLSQLWDPVAAQKGPVVENSWPQSHSGKCNVEVSLMTYVTSATSSRDSKVLFRAGA